MTENSKLNSEKLKKLAEERNQVLQELLTHGRYFKMIVREVGYIPECALKAIICNYHNDVYPEHLNGYKTHKLDALLHKSKLTDNFKNEQRNNPKFKASWSTISSWTPEFRYETDIKKQEANKYMDALNNENGGVYKWIKNYW